MKLWARVHVPTTTELRDAASAPTTRRRDVPTAADANAQIGRRLRARRAVLEMTMAELGTSIGVSTQMVQKLETGRNRINAGDLPALAAKLGTTVTWLIEGGKP